MINQDLQEQFNIQIKLIQSSIEKFEEGDILEAINLAIRIRVLVHDTERSTSLLKQMGCKDKLKYYDTSVERIENQGFMPGPYVGLMQFVIGNDKVFALLDDNPNMKKVFFDERWNGIIFIDTDGTSLSRKDVVLNIANKMGAHVDLNYDTGYEKIMKNKSLGISIGDDKYGYKPIEKLEYIAVRQIIHELLKSIYSDYKCNYNFKGNGYITYINF